MDAPTKDTGWIKLSDYPEFPPDVMDGVEYVQPFRIITPGKSEPLSPSDSYGEGKVLAVIDGITWVGFPRPPAYVEAMFDGVFGGGGASSPPKPEEGD